MGGPASSPPDPSPKTPDEGSDPGGCGFGASTHVPPVTAAAPEAPVMALDAPVTNTVNSMHPFSPINPFATANAAPVVITPSCKGSKSPFSEALLIIVAVLLLLLLVQSIASLKRMDSLDIKLNELVAKKEAITTSATKASPAQQAPLSTSSAASVATATCPRTTCQALDPNTLLECTDKSCFYLVRKFMTWEGAQDYAVARGGHLVHIADGEKQRWIHARVRDRDIWLGGKRRNAPSSLVWSWMMTALEPAASAQCLKYTQWREGEPNNSGGNESCLMMREDGFWNDATCTTLAAFVMEVPVSSA